MENERKRKLRKKKKWNGTHIWWFWNRVVTIAIAFYITCYTRDVCTYLILRNSCHLYTSTKYIHKILHHILLYQKQYVSHRVLKTFAFHNCKVSFNFIIVFTYFVHLFNNTFFLYPHISVMNTGALVRTRFLVHLTLHLH